METELDSVLTIKVKDCTMTTNTLQYAVCDISVHGLQPFQKIQSSERESVVPLNCLEERKVCTRGNTGKILTLSVLQVVVFFLLAFFNQRF